MVAGAQSRPSSIRVRAHNGDRGRAGLCRSRMACCLCVTRWTSTGSSPSIFTCASTPYSADRIHSGRCVLCAGRSRLTTSASSTPLSSASSTPGNRRVRTIGIGYTPGPNSFSHADTQPYRALSARNSVKVEGPSDTRGVSRLDVGHVLAVGRRPPPTWRRSVRRGNLGGRHPRPCC
jgi:hypothetical protein